MVHQLLGRANRPHYDGKTWSRLKDAPADLTGLWGFGSHDVFAAGYDGSVLRYNGSDWTRIGSSTTETLTSIWGSSPTDLFAAGSDGAILHYGGNRAP